MRPSILSALIGSSSLVHAASTINQKCIGTLCYSVNVPDSTAQSGSGDIFFQITGPSSYSWVGLGTGSSMSGSNMFIIYQSADGTNVTLSPRKGSGHTPPSADSSAQAFLMDGSGISGDQMIANVRCKFT
jgi:hypothetical protein